MLCGSQGEIKVENGNTKPISRAICRARETAPGEFSAAGKEVQKVALHKLKVMGIN